MNNYMNVIVIVEGQSEQIFIEKILAPYLKRKNIRIHANVATKKGQNGGDIRFARLQRDIKIHLKQQSNTYVTTFIDYYGTREWPGLDEVSALHAPLPALIAKTINDATKKMVISLFPEQQPERRFIPFIAVHEFEALLFSDASILARKLNINESEITAVISQCGSPEAINNSPQTAPSKRLEGWLNKRFRKTTMGITIAEEIGIEKMRSKCPLFDNWLSIFEDIQRSSK